MARHRAIIARHLMVASLEDKADIEKRAKVAANNVDSAGQRYEPLIPAADAREAYAALLPAWKAYLAECQKMLEASRNGDSVRAMKIFVSEVSVAGLNTERNLERLVELNLKGAGEAETVGDGIYSRIAKPGVRSDRTCRALCDCRYRFPSNEHSAADYHND